MFSGLRDKSMLVHDLVGDDGKLRGAEHGGGDQSIAKAFTHIGFTFILGILRKSHD